MVCSGCGEPPAVRVLEAPDQLVPEMGRLAVGVNEYVASGEDPAVIAVLSVQRAAAVMLVVEAMRQTCPAGVEFASWCGAFLLAWEMGAAPGPAGGGGSS